MGEKVGIGEAAKALGVQPITFRRWEKAFKIEVERTPTGHRRYDLSKMYGVMPRRNNAAIRPTIAYARVSSNDQQSDLVRQVALLESYYAANGWTYEVLQDLCSGLNYIKKD
jgi:putative resolvase